MNPYEILQIPNNASQEQIKAAFHKRAKETHPDTNPNNPNAAEEFNKVVEAYNILSDISSRKELDEMIRAGSYSENYTAEMFNHSEGFNYYSAEELHYIINELRRQAAPAKAAAVKYSLRGAAWFIGGLIVTAITLTYGRGLLAWGAILFGGIEAVKGFKAYFDINAELNKMEKEIWDEYLNRGKSASNEASSETNTASNVTNSDYVPNENKKKPNKKKLGIIAGIVALAVVIALTVSGLSDRPLSIKNGSHKGDYLDLYTGDEKALEYEGGGIEENDYNNVLITMEESDDTDVVSIEGNTIKALKPGTVNLNAFLKKGLSTYKGSFTVNVTNRTIGFNEPDTIKLYAGDKHDIDIDLETIPKDKDESIEWTVEDESKILKVKNNKIIALKKGSANIKAYLDDDGSIYEGSLTVEIDAKPVEFYSGEIVKGYVGDAPFKVTAPASDDVYIYMKGVGEETDDFAFLVKRGETSQVNAPIGSYMMHVAYGTTWYGQDSLFGETGSYYASIEETKFYIEGNYAYGMELDLSSKPTGLSIGYDSFPR